MDWRKIFGGEGVCILPNVTIGKNSIIGANSVVTKDIPENSIVAGVPGKVIRSILESSEQIIVNSEKLIVKSER